MADDDTTPTTPSTPSAAGTAADLEPDPVARPGWRSRLARVPRTPVLAGGVLAAVLLAGASGFALGRASGGPDGHRPPFDGERMSEGTPGMPGDGDDHGPGHRMPPAGMPPVPQGVLPGAPAVPPPAVQDDDGDGPGADLDGGSDDGSGSGTDDGADDGADAS